MPYRENGWPNDEGDVLFIEYDVTSTGEIELVALINAVEATGADADGSDWLAWRTAEFDDGAMGCVGVAARRAHAHGRDRGPG